MRSKIDSSCCHKKKTIVRNNSSSQRYQISTKLDSPLFFLPFLCLLFCNTQGYATVTTTATTTIKPTQSLTVSNVFHFFFLFFVLQCKQTIKPLTNTHSDQTYQTQPIFSVALLWKICLKQPINKNKSFQHRLLFSFPHPREYSPRHSKRVSKNWDLKKTTLKPTTIKTKR